MSWDADRNPPSSAYLLLLDHPAVRMPSTVTDAMAEKYKTPILMSRTTSTREPSVPNGITTQSNNAATATTTGAALNMSTSARRRSEEHTSELQSLAYLVCRLLLEKKKQK